MNTTTVTPLTLDAARRIIEQFVVELEAMALTLTPYIDVTSERDYSSEPPLSCRILFKGWPVFVDDDEPGPFLQLAPRHEDPEARFFTLCGTEPLETTSVRTDELLPSRWANFRIRNLENLNRHFITTGQQFKVRLNKPVAEVAHALVKLWQKKSGDQNFTTAGLVAEFKPPLAVVCDRGAIPLDFDEGALKYLVSDEALQRIVAAA